MIIDIIHDLYKFSTYTQFMRRFVIYIFLNLKLCTTIYEIIIIIIDTSLNLIQYYGIINVRTPN